MSKLLRLCCLGRNSSYSEILKLQENLVDLRKNGIIADTLLQVQHAPVYTLGKRGTPEDFLEKQEELRAQGFDIQSSPRGGETTFHGPGQIVLYPIVNLRSLQVGPRAFVEALEDIIVRAVGVYGVHARGRVPGRTGVWVGDAKIGAIGVKIGNGITSHGLAVNVNNDLSPFRNIIPCGISDKVVTSLLIETGSSQVTPEFFGKHLVSSFVSQFQYEAVRILAEDELLRT